jgi:putative FmdB family regulatory protein
MPIYEYACQKCGNLLEIIQKFNDKQLTKCDKCGGELKKMISSTSFVLKGTGWYKTDYPSKPKKDKHKPEKSETKKENKKESKPETKKETAVKP